MLEGFQLIGRDWRYLFVNDVVCRHGQKSREELLGRTMMEVYPGIDTTPVFAALSQCMEERMPQRMENAFQYADGSTRWFDLSIQPAPEGVFVLSTEITERKLAELNVARRLTQLAALRSIDLAILSSHDAKTAVDVVVREAIITLNVDAARILLITADSSPLVTSSQLGFSARYSDPAPTTSTTGMAERCMRERRSLYASDIAENQGAFSSAGEGFVWCAATPLVTKDGIRGVLEVHRRERLDPDVDWLAFFEALAGQAAIAVESAKAFADLHRAHADLHLAYEATIEGWSRAMDLRDRETEGHTLRVTAMTMLLARAAGMSDADLVHVRRGALLHDIGKLGVPDRILFKSGTLTEDEWVLMRKHPEYAYEMLLPIWYLEPALDIPHCHHERWDGTGYPRGLKGEQIPHAARLFAVVDVWDALRSDRPYRPAWPDDDVMAYLRERSGSHFDPAAVELFFEIMRSGVQVPPPVIGLRW
jgi:PAS domain S-box-containing protein/putative nucleotidyltransferase with HDIG domain